MRTIVNACSLPAGVSSALQARTSPSQERPLLGNFCRPLELPLLAADSGAVASFASVWGPPAPRAAVNKETRKASILSRLASGQPKRFARRGTHSCISCRPISHARTRSATACPRDSSIMLCVVSGKNSCGTRQALSVASISLGRKMLSRDPPRTSNGVLTFSVLGRSRPILSTEAIVVSSCSCFPYNSSCSSGMSSERKNSRASLEVATAG